MIESVTLLLLVQIHKVNCYLQKLYLIKNKLNLFPYIILGIKHIKTYM